MFYKLNDKDAVSAKNNEPLKVVAVVDDVVYYYTNEELQAPFIKVEEQDVPFGNGMDLTFKRKALVEKAQAKLRFDFTSDALGSLHSYDLHSEQDQANLMQALLYVQINSGMISSVTANIRCVDQDGIKDNRPHTKKQLEKLFSDWYVYKSTILDQYSTLKIDVKTNNPLELDRLDEQE